VHLSLQFIHKLKEVNKLVAQYYWLYKPEAKPRHKHRSKRYKLKAQYHQLHKPEAELEPKDKHKNNEKWSREELKQRVFNILMDLCI
jgi:hypothetical protein